MGLLLGLGFELKKMKRISILGSTGSIGVKALEVIACYPNKFQVVALAGGKNFQKLQEQIGQFHPELVCMVDPEAATRLALSLPKGKTKILTGIEGLMAIATHPGVEIVVAALAGSIGLAPMLEAIRAQKKLAIANKEPLVMAGEILIREAQERRVMIIPVDSEHSAIFQALAGHRREDIKRIILTASGGPFLHTPLPDLAQVTPPEALNHPQWRMGQKVSIDSASLMNKGLEVIEARWLFQVPPAKIEVLIHPQAIVHSMVEYIDGSIIAQMSLPDMRGPIAYALAYPERLDLARPSLNLAQIGNLTFYAVDKDKFPALELAYQALQKGGTMPTVLNAANEVAVEAFLTGRIAFLQIAQLIKKTMEKHEPLSAQNLENIWQAHYWAQGEARKMVERGVP